MFAYPGRILADLDTEFIEKGGKKLIKKKHEKIVFRILVSVAQGFFLGGLSPWAKGLVSMVLSQVLEGNETDDEIVKLINRVLKELKFSLRVQKATKVEL
jgi:hypothetical protein